MIDISCLHASKLYFRAQRRQLGRCETVTASKWTCPQQLFHNGQNHPRILSVLAISREQQSTREGIERTFQNSGRQALRMQEIDALAAASGSAKAQALGRKYSRVVNGATLAVFSAASAVHRRINTCLWLKAPCAIHSQSTHQMARCTGTLLVCVRTISRRILLHQRAAWLACGVRAVHQQQHTSHADLARSGNHTEAWKVFTKLQDHGASISYNAHHQLIVACLKVWHLIHLLWFTMYLILCTLTWSSA